MSRARFSRALRFFISEKKIFLHFSKIKKSFLVLTKNSVLVNLNSPMNDIDNEKTLYTAEVDVATENASASTSLDPREFASILVSAKINFESITPATENIHGRLVEIMNSAAVNAIMEASEDLANKTGITRHQALHQIILSFKELDHLWNQVLLKEGFARLSSQYH